MKTVVIGHLRLAGLLIEFLDDGRMRPALVLRETDRQVAVVEAGRRERTLSRALVLNAYPDRTVNRGNLAAEVARLEAERTALAVEIDLGLLWEIVQEQNRSFTAEELSELFFGRRAPVDVSVMIEALLNDRLYFVRRHMEFLPRPAEQVERLRVQQDKTRLRSEANRRTRSLLEGILAGRIAPAVEEAAPLVAELKAFLENPFTRSKDLEAMLAAAAPELLPGEAAFEILERLGSAMDGPRYVIIGGIRTKFPSRALAEAAAAAPPARPQSDDSSAVTIDDDDTVEIDDALSCEPLADDGLRVRVHIALVADFVARGGAVDREAAARATTIYLPEATIRMLPDAIACESASLIAGVERHVLTTDLRLSAAGDLVGYAIYPSQLKVSQRLSYERADAWIAAESAHPEALKVRRLYEMAQRLRERRRAAGAVIVSRREPKVKVAADGSIEISVIDNASASRMLVAEFMVLSNHVLARHAANNRIPIIYRVQPSGGGDLATLRPRLSIYPEYHAGIGLDCYAQISSPIRRYMDLVLQRQIVAALTDGKAKLPYEADELLTVIANAEASEAASKDLERRAKRYWTLRFLERECLGAPLQAIVTRDGASAELFDYAVRGTLHGAPNISSQARILAQIGNIDPVRGVLSLEYLSTLGRDTDGDR
ncbi:RNB domain-containing ribonuclease [bacterium]|nr:RNB domain-containing ribonuclease [bacterium]